MSGKPLIPNGYVKTALDKIGVPARYYKAKLDDFKNITNLNWTQGGFFLQGSPGIGKTHLAAALLRSRLDPKHVKTLTVIKKNAVGEKWYALDDGAAMWIAVPRFLSIIRSTFNRKTGPTQDDIVKKHAKADLLVLDDLGAENTTDWTASTLYDLISWRESALKDTIITSNQSIGQIEQWEGRIASRLSAMPQINLPDHDRRPM